MDAGERLVDFHFAFQVHGDDEVTRRLVGGEPRIISAMLYQAADRVATEGLAETRMLFHGRDLKREAPRRIDHGWAGSLLVWLAGVAFGSAAVAIAVMS